MELHQRNVNCYNSYRICIPNNLFFLHKIIPRATIRLTTNTGVKEPALVEVSEGTGVFAWTLEDIVVLVV